MIVLEYSIEVGFDRTLKATPPFDDWQSPFDSPVVTDPFRCPQVGTMTL